MKNTYAINVPVTDLRSSPEPRVHTDGRDLNRESQLFYGESVSLIEDQGDYCLVDAHEQLVLQQHHWIPYRGLVFKKHLQKIPHTQLSPNIIAVQPYSKIQNASGESLLLSLGTRLKGELKGNQWHITDPFGNQWISELTDFDYPGKDHDILNIARKCVGWPYLWGGRSSYCSKQTSVDCSGFVQILYQILGISLPRNSHDQYLNSKKITQKELSAGDLIFTADHERPDRVTHVMLYAGSGNLLEATIVSNSVREISFFERFGFPLENISTKRNSFYFGRYQENRVS